VSGGRLASSFACLLIVAAIAARPSAAAVSQEVPVPGGIASLARSLAIDPVPDRSRFIHEVTRILYDTPELPSAAVAAFVLSLRQPPHDRSRVGPRAAASDDVIPVPLTADVWSSAVFHRKVTPEALVSAIVADRQAAWLCHGLTMLDDETLEYFAAHPSLLTRIYERSAAFFAAFGGSIRIHDNRVVPAGDVDAVPLWEGAVDERVSRPERFVPALLEAADGRLAYLYRVVSDLDAARRAFVLGSWLPAPLRQERFRVLTTSGIGAIREWHARTLPFNRASYELEMTVVRLAVREDGRPLPPASRGLWGRVVGGGDTSADQPIDAAWLLERFLATDVRQRADRLDTLGFAQRVVGDRAIDNEELVFMLRSIPRHRALMLALERAGVRNPATYSAALRHASRLTAFDGRKGYVVQAQFQGALAIVARLMAVGSVDVPSGERLIEQLAALPLSNGYAGGVARWIRTSLHPLLPAASDFESALTAGVAGPLAGASRRVSWEGQLYRLDLAASERQRMERVREKQHAPRLDLPLQMAEAARQLIAEKASAEDLLDAAAQFEALAVDLPQRSREEEVDSVPAGVPPPSSPHDALRRASDELTRAAKNRDLRRGPKLAESIVELADDLLARNLLSFVYAMSLGDPDGTILLANDVSHRHDFGFGLKDPEMRGRVTWAIPRQEVSPGSAWHVSGSLLAMDVGLATLALRRVATDHVLEAPKLTNNARDTFATTVALMDANALHDDDRDAIAEATERGTARALAATGGPALDQIAAEIHLDAARRRALEWTIAHEPERIVSMYSTTELLVLGGADVAALDAWGMAVIPATGCLCSRLFPAGAWATLGGRPQLGLEAAVLPDLQLRIAVLLRELALPAALTKVILSGAMQDFIDESRPTDDADWLSLSRSARALTRERVEDYIAAATAVGPLMPEPTRSPQPER
jgi:hypothetical protein